MTEHFKALTALLVALAACIGAVATLASNVADLRERRSNDFETVVVLAQQLAEARTKECR